MSEEKRFSSLLEARPDAGFITNREQANQVLPDPETYATYTPPINTGPRETEAEVRERERDAHLHALGLPSGALQTMDPERKQDYLKKLKRSMGIFHPDKHPHATSEELAEQNRKAGKRFAAIEYLEQEDSNTK